MKYSFLLFLFIYNFTYSQVETPAVEMLSFQVNYPANAEDIEDIDFAKEKPKCEFTLKGKIPLQYSFYLESDSLAVLYHFKNEKFEFQETLNFQPYLWHLDNNLLFSNFKIIDFDNDGDEDLVCWVFSNINGNEWTVIFINDQKQQKLVRLYNTADQTDIWNSPRYDEQTSIINTELFGSAFGMSEESSYKLQNDLSIIPLKKHFQDRTQTRMYDYYYVGKNGKWKLKSKKATKN